MGKLSSLKIVLSRIVEALQIALKLVILAYQTVRNFLSIRVPFIRALISRHTRNPSTLFVDLAIFILSLYLVIGITGYILVYPNKSESRATEVIASVYPLPAAKVDKSFVWSHKFLKRLRFLTTYSANAPKDAAKPPADVELRSRVLDGLIEDQIIYLEAKNRGISVTDEELDKAFEKQGKADDIKKKVKELYGMNLSDFKEVIAEQVLKEKVKNSVLTRIRIRHILVTTLPTANEAKKQIDGGKDFAEVAKEFSQDAKTKDSGGDLGYWRKTELATQIAPAVEDAAFAAQVNQIVGPTQSQYGYHILQVTERSGDNLKSYDEWLKEVYKNYSIKQYIKY